MNISKIVFMGSPDFALPSLEVIYNNFSSNLVAVFSQPDKPKGRNKILSPTPIKAWALTKNIPIFTPQNKNELAAEVLKIDPDLIIVVAFGMILPKTITDKYFCLNIHGSLLPKYRGASPINAALLNQEKETGITLMRIEEKMDAGPILAQEKTTVQAQDNFGTLHDKLAQMGAKLLKNYLINFYLKDKINLQKQDEMLATYCKKIQKEDYILNLKMEPKEFLAKVKAFSPIPGAYLEINNKRYIILDAEIIDDKIKIKTIKPEGKSAMNYKDFLLGHKDILEP
jgi:methionyl-tRNA formyltransferase